MSLISDRISMCLVSIFDGILMMMNVYYKQNMCLKCREVTETHTYANVNILPFRFHIETDLSIIHPYAHACQFKNVKKFI